MRWLVIILALMASPLAAEQVVLGLSKDEVAINTSFKGSEILIFGAVKRETPIPEGDPLHVVITVSGPKLPVVVRRKDRRLGIWVNVESVEMDGAPSFYAVATSGLFGQALTPGEDLRHQVSIPRAIRSVGALHEFKDIASYTRALIRIRKDNDAYIVNEGGVIVNQDTLFRTSIQLPANLTEGDYTARIFLTRGGKVISQYRTVIDVRKVGLERWLYTLSREKPLWYGLMSLAIAIAAGWGASAAFRILQRQ